MINRINSMDLSAINNLTGLGNLNEGSKSNIFQTVLISLLSAISEKNKTVTNPNDRVSIDNIIGGLNSVKLSDIGSNGRNFVNKINLDNTNDLSKKDRIEKAINTYSEKYGVDKNLIEAIIKVESDFNPNTVSWAGAKGLMQLMPENCKILGIVDPFNIEQNIDGGARHIKEYINMYKGDIKMALMAYNGGPTRMFNRGVRSIDDIYKMPKETQNYVTKVMNYYKGL